MVPRKLASPLRVLVVDDFPDGRELVAEYLTFRGFDVHVAWPRVLKRDPAALEVPGLSVTPSRSAKARRRSAGQVAD
jgi:CheY-like chemotaxis protein